MITYGSVCSGIEAATTAWHPLGWSPRWFAEIEPFPSAVLAHHWPDVPNLGDFTAIRDKIAAGAVEAPDVLVGGTPCQAFSVAGLRQSLDDKRGQLTLEFVRLADAIDSARSLGGQRPVTVVWENVPGVLNTPDNAFGCFLAGLAGEDDPLEPPGGRWTNAGYVRGPRRAVAWRILDAQYFGVAQRRRRVFVVASAGGIRPEQVLFEIEGVRRDSPPSREAGKGVAHDVAPCPTSGGRGVERTGETRGQDPVVATFQQSSMAGKGTIGWDESGIAKPVKTQVDGQMVCFGGNNTASPIDVSTALNACASASGRMDFESEAFAVVGFNARQDPDSWVGRTGPLDTDGSTQAVAVRDISQTLTSNYGKQVDSSDTGLGPNIVFPAMRVRRLTPTECERLQGFPDGHTLIPWRGKPAEDCADGPRYRALGNSMAVPVMRWIGARIDAALRECQP